MGHGYSINGHLISTLLAHKLFEAVPVNAGGGGQCGDTNRGLECLRAWIGTNKTRFNLVSFNFGLHDLASSTWSGPPEVSLETYSRNLRNITRLFRRRLPSAKLLFILTTPVPTTKKLSPPRNESAVIAYNSAAKKVMQEESKNCYQRINNVHFWPNGYIYIVKAIVAAAKILQYGGVCPDFLRNISVGICH